MPQMQRPDPGPFTRTTDDRPRRSSPTTGMNTPDRPQTSPPTSAFKLERSHWAHPVAKHFDDGQLYLNLHGFDSSASAMTPADALGALLYSLGPPAGHVPGDLDAQADLYRSVLAAKHVLIVLENARDAGQVRPLLSGSPGCLVIATSRNPRAGLAMTEGARLLTLKLPSVLTARETLERRLGADRVAAEPAAAEEIIQLCGRLPLALAIVAARAAAHSDFTLASIVTDLRRTWGRLDVFGTAGVAVDARTVFSWSYRHLTPHACHLSGCCRCSQPPISRSRPAPACSAMHRKRRAA